MKFRAFFMSFLGIMSFCVSQEIEAQSRAVSSQLEASMRQSARIAGRGADDIPLDQFRSFSRRADKKYLGLGRKGVRQLDDLAIATMRKTDPRLMRKIDNLNVDDRAKVLRIADGARQLDASGGNVIRRGRIVKQTGPDGMLLVSKHGDEAISALKVIEDAVQRGDLPPAALSDFARNMNRMHPNAFNRVWEKAIKPNWGKYLAAGTLVTFIVAPEEFLDGAGYLTQKGAEAFGEFVPELVLNFFAAMVVGFFHGVGDVATGPYALGFWVIFLGFFSWGGFKVYPLIMTIRAKFSKKSSSL